MSYYCANCAHALTTIVKEVRDGKPIYHRNGRKEVVHKVRCGKERWRTNQGNEQKKSIIAMWKARRSCGDYKSMGEEIEEYRETLPSTQEEAKDRGWGR